MNVTIGTDDGSVATLTDAGVPSRRPGLIDRLAMRVGLALIIWGQRDSRPRSSAQDLLLLRAAGEESRRVREGWRDRLPPIL